MSRLYRRWAFESAALDLALRQAGRSLDEALAREPRPVTFVVSLRLGEPATIDPVRRRLERYPGAALQARPDNSWTTELIAELAATGAVDSVDLKGHYRGTLVDVEADPELYRLVAEGFPDAWIEDPDLDDADATRCSSRTATASPGTRRSTRSPTSRRCPSRRGWSTSSRRASAACRALLRRLRLLRASAASAPTAAASSSSARAAARSSTWPRCSTPTRPNDVAPGGYNVPDPPDGLPASPLAPEPSPTGFRWGEWSER